MAIFARDQSSAVSGHLKMIRSVSAGSSPHARILRSKPDSSHKPFLFRFLRKSVGFHLGPLNPSWGAMGYPATFILVQQIKLIPGGEIKSTEPKLDGYMRDVGARTALLCFQWYHTSCFQQSHGQRRQKKGEKRHFVATHVTNGCIVAKGNKETRSHIWFGRILLYKMNETVKQLSWTHDIFVWCLMWCS